MVLIPNLDFRSMVICGQVKAASSIKTTSRFSTWSTNLRKLGLSSGLPFLCKSQANALLLSAFVAKKGKYEVARYSKSFIEKKSDIENRELGS